MSDFNKAYKILIANEGGYQNHTKDTGNYLGGVLIGTNKGITPKVLAKFLGRKITKEDMLNLSDETAKKIYKQKYWFNLDKIKDQNVANIIFDGNVNHGVTAMRSIVYNAIKHFNIDIEKSELYLEKGIKKINKIKGKNIFEKIKEERKKRYYSLNRPEFIKGWIRRINTFYYNGLPLSKTQLAIIGISTSVFLIPAVIFAVHIYKQHKN